MANARTTSKNSSEPPVSVAEISRLLMRKKSELLARGDSARRNLDEQVVDTPGDEADLSVIDSSADYFLGLANAVQDELRELDAAFDRIRSRVYGFCETCEEPIGSARLRHLPAARLCVECQSVAERTPDGSRPRFKF